MHIAHKAQILFGVACWLLLMGCRNHETASRLHDRIVAANTSQYCHLPDACFNPSVLAYEKGFAVTTFAGPKPQNVEVPATELAKYLQGLPMQAWPRGPSIVITLSDDVYDQRAVEENFQTARRLCRSMGLEVEVRPGG